MSYYHGPKIVTDGLVLCVDPANIKSYPGSGSGVYDIGGNSQTGELVNGPVFTTEGNNKFFSFNGTTNNRLIKIPNNTALDTQTPSVEIWIKTNSLNQNGFWFEKGTVNTQYSLFQESTNLIWRKVVTPTTNNTTITLSSYITTNEWNQVVATYTTGSSRIYINGTLITNQNETGTIDTNTGGMSIAVFGGYSGGRSYYYNGNIGPLRIYNKVLSASEILQNYNAVKNRFGR